MEQKASKKRKKLCTSIIEMIELHNETKQSNFFFDDVSEIYLDVDKEFAKQLSAIMGELKIIITKYKNCWYHIEKTSYDSEKAFVIYEIHDMEEESAWD